jgi:hypothetical protein
LRRPSSFATSSLRGRIEQVFDLRLQCPPRRFHLPTA